jgi:hypothetical protein
MYWSGAPCAARMHQCRWLGRACWGVHHDPFRRSSDIPCVQRDQSAGRVLGTGNLAGIPAPFKFQLTVFMRPLVGVRWSSPKSSRGSITITPPRGNAMKFIRRSDLPPQTRLHLVMLAWLNQGVYGTMTQIANAYGISRTFLSQLLMAATLQLAVLFSTQPWLQSPAASLEPLAWLLFIGNIFARVERYWQKERRRVG